MAEKTGILFLNARSGSADEARTEKMRAAATERGLEVVDIGPGVDCGAVVTKAIKAGTELFIAAGGDGTIHHVMQSLVGTPARLGIIPAGTMNHLAKDLEIPLEWEEALELALTGSARQIDVGSTNGTYFTNIIVLGLYADMVRERERLRHWYGKTRAYLRAIYKSVSRFHKVTLAVETEQKSQVIRTPMFAIAVNGYEFNSPGVMAPKLSFDAGVLALYWLPQTSRRAVVRIMLRFVGGRLRIGEDLKSLNTRAVKVQSRHSMVRIGMNGELATMRMPMEVKIVPGGLRVVVPQTSS